MTVGLGLAALGVTVAAMAGVIRVVTWEYPHPTLYKIMLSVASLLAFVGVGLAWHSR